MRNYYKVLGVSESATDAEIKQAYRKLASIHHPDHNPHDPLSMLEMKKINEAYDVLSDQEKRSHYDRINIFHGAPIGTQDGNLSEVAGLQLDDLQTAISSPRHDPVGMSAGLFSGQPERIVDALWMQERYSITSCMKNVLWIDVFVSIVYLVYFFLMRSDLPIMPSGLKHFRMYGRTATSWMTHFALASHLELVASAIAIYWMKKTARSHFLKIYLFIKCNLFVSVAATFFGLTTTDTSIFIPTAVLLWKAFLIASLFFSRLNQDLWRSS